MLVCPLLSKGGTLEPCVAARCAWFDQRTRRCAVLDLSALRETPAAQARRRMTRRETHGCSPDGEGEDASASRALLDAGADAAILLSPAGIILDMNQAAATVLGGTVPGLQGHEHLARCSLADRAGGYGRRSRRWHVRDNRPISGTIAGTGSSTAASIPYSIPSAGGRSGRVRTRHHSAARHGNGARPADSTSPSSCSTPSRARFSGRTNTAGISAATEPSPCSSSEKARTCWARPPTTSALRRSPPSISAGTSNSSRNRGCRSTNGWSRAGTGWSATSSSTKPPSPVPWEKWPAWWE